MQLKARISYIRSGLLRFVVPWLVLSRCLHNIMYGTPGTWCRGMVHLVPGAGGGMVHLVPGARGGCRSGAERETCDLVTIQRTAVG